MTTTPLVIDSSVIIKWLSSDEERYIDLADNLLKDAQEGKIEIVVPELAKYEVGNVLLFSKKLSIEQGKLSLAQFYSLPITFIAESQDIAELSYSFAKNLGITYYDAVFLSIAKQYGATLVTENIKHQGKSSAIEVISLKDY